MAWTEWNERSAYLLVKTDWKTGEKLWKKAQKWDESIGAWLVTGSWDLIVWLDAYSWDETYRRVVDVRKMKGVEATSTHFVYKGMKNGRWWWEWPTGAWVSMRSPHLNGEMKGLKKWKWASSITSIPGDWDYLVWAGGKNWNETWKNVGEMNKQGWRTETHVPVKTWWNKSWKRKWW